MARPDPLEPDSLTADRFGHCPALWLALPARASSDLMPSEMCEDWATGEDGASSFDPIQFVQDSFDKLVELAELAELVEELAPRAIPDGAAKVRVREGAPLHVRSAKVDPR